MTTALQQLKTHNSKLITLLLALCVALVAGLAPPLITAAVVVGLAAGALLLKWPVWGAYLLVLSVPVQKAVSYDAGPIEITVTQTLFVVVLGVWWAWLAVREDRRFVLTPIAVALFFYFIATLPSLWVAASLTQSLAELSRWLVAILAYVILVNSVQTRRQMHGLIAVMLVSAMFEAALGLVQAYTGVGPESFSVQGELTRAYGTIGAPNSFAGYINLSLPLALSLMVYFWGRWASGRSAECGMRNAERGARTIDYSSSIVHRPSSIAPHSALRIPHSALARPLLLTFISLTLFWSVVTSLSRGAWIGLTLGVLAMLLALWRRAAWAIAALSMLAVGLVGLGLIGALPAPITDRVGLLLGQLSIFDPRGIVPTPENYALVERMVHWHTAGNMFLHNPWVGVGIGNFNELFVRYGVQGWPYSAGHAHNYYLHALAETGIVGTTFYLAMLITALTVGVRALRRARAAGDVYGEAVVIGALGILVTFMAHNFFEDLHVLNMGIHWGAALALFTLVQLHYQTKTNQKSRSDF